MTQELLVLAKVNYFKDFSPFSLVLLTFGFLLLFGGIGLKWGLFPIILRQADHM
jgi:hypothetical protein